MLPLPRIDGSRRPSIVFCDESGNTGPNYLDQNQPFYTLAGWVVPDEAVVDAAVAVEAARKSTCPQRQELKASSFLQTERARLSAVELFRKLGTLGCVPLYVIGEKRYCLSARIVDSFCDPLYNPLLTHGFSRDSAAKSELANLIYQKASDEALSAFESAYRRPNRLSLESALNALTDSARKSMCPEVAVLLEGVLPRLDALVDDEMDTGVIGRVGTALNMPVLVMFLMLVENLAVATGDPAPIIVHDEQHLYGPGYAEIVKVHRGFRHALAGLAPGNSMRAHPNGITRFEMGDSRSRTLLQAADVLAGSIGYLLDKSRRNTELTGSEKALSDTILPGLIATPSVSWTICSDVCLKDLWRTLFHGYPRVNEGVRLDLPRDRRVERLDLLPTTFGVATRQKFALDLPLVGIVGRESGKPMLLAAGAKDASGGRVKEGPIALLFRDEERANAFLHLYEAEELTEQQVLIHLTATTLSKLVALLREAAEFAEVLVLDPGKDGAAATFDLLEVIANMEAVATRVESLARTGLLSVALQSHTIGAVDVLSLLASDGTYLAMRQIDGKVYRGKTRNLALESLRTAEGLDQ